MAPTAGERSGSGSFGDAVSWQGQSCQLMVNMPDAMRLSPHGIVQAFMAQWEGFEPYESRKRRVLTYPQVLQFQGFSRKPLIPMGLRLWSNLWSKWDATRRCEAPKGGSK